MLLAYFLVIFLNFQKDSSFPPLPSQRRFIRYLTALVPEAPVADIPPKDAFAPGSRKTPTLLATLSFNVVNLGVKTEGTGPNWNSTVCYKIAVVGFCFSH